jgi:hypothetical protein
MSSGLFVVSRRLMHRVSACCAIGVALGSAPVTVRAHHTALNLSVPAPGCGWAEGDSLRDRSTLLAFCQRWVPSSLGIRMAFADHETVQIEASPALVAALRDDTRSVSALLRDWLRHWRAESGYRTAAIVLMRNHVEIAKIYTTMSGDVVAVR